MEQKDKEAVIVEDGDLLRIISLGERKAIGVIHKDYPAYPMKRYFNKIEGYLGFRIVNLEPYMDAVKEKLKELE